VWLRPEILAQLSEELRLHPHIRTRSQLIRQRIPEALFIDALTMNLAPRYGWKFAVCSFENPPAEHIAKLAEKHLGMPFWDGPNLRMSEAQLRDAFEWVADRFFLIRADDEAPTIDWILARAKAAVLRCPRRGYRSLQRD